MTTKRFRTYVEVCASDPECVFIVHGCSTIVGDLENELYWIFVAGGYNAEMPIVFLANVNYFSMDAESILEQEEADWVDNTYEDWNLDYSRELLEELQAVLDKIADYDKPANTSYQKGEQVDITEIWQQAKLKYMTSLEIGGKHD